MNEEAPPSPKINSGSSSSRQSRSSIQSALGSWIAATHNERLRASSWDDSDEDSAAKTKPEKIISKSRRLYSADVKKTAGSVAFEINELKKQFFENIKKEERKAGNELDSVEMKISNDRRKSPARIRRRSSSSSSPVREVISRVSSEEERELDQISLRSADYDTKFYVNHFFSELKMKQQEDAPGNDDEGPIYDSECMEMYNQLKSWEGKDADGFLCKTSRKLSQILEVEENRKDLDKKSEENVNLFRRNFKTPEALSPLETARSAKGDKIFESLRHERKEDRFKPLNLDDFGNFHTLPHPSHGSLSDRAGGTFRSKIQDNFISLSAKTGTTHLVSPTFDEADAPLQYFCFANPIGVKSFPKDAFPKDKGKNSESNDSLRNDSTRNSTPRKSEENRSERRSRRIRSGKSRAGNSESPKFTLSIDSARSLKVEDLDTPDSTRQEASEKLSTVNMSNSERSQRSIATPSPDGLKQSGENVSKGTNRFELDDTPKTNSNSFRSDVSFEKNTEKRLEAVESCIKQEPPTPPPTGSKNPTTGCKTESKSPVSSRSRRRTQKESDGNFEAQQSSSKADAATWSDLIDAFQDSPNHSFNLESHFPGFPRQKENSSNVNREVILNDYKLEVCDGSHESTDPKLLGNEPPIDVSGKEEEENLKNSNLDYKDGLLDKIKKDEGARPLQAPNLFYFNVDERGPFGIGEFGDVTYCTAGNSDTVDFGKPKDHGDGIPTLKSQGVMAFASEKREKDGKNVFWSELRGEFRGAPRKDGTDDIPRYIPIGMKTSKSDNCLNARIHEEVLDESLSRNKIRIVENKILEIEKVKKETASECSRSESCSEDLESPEFEGERTPRLSKSLPDLRKLTTKNGKSKRKVAGPFEKASVSYGDGSKEPAVGKEEAKFKNWLSLKSPDRKETHKKAKKSKTKQKKKEGSPKEPFHEYLAVRKSRQTVPPLKLRNSNCFQNFYKRFISVFCLTSNSSAATSK